MDLVEELGDPLDLIDDDEAEVTEKLGRQIRIRCSEGRPLSFQGIVLTAENGRIAFNNQVKTRMSRNDREIRRLIHTALFSDKAEE